MVASCCKTRFPNSNLSISFFYTFFQIFLWTWVFSVSNSKTVCSSNNNWLLTNLHRFSHFKSITQSLSKSPCLYLISSTSTLKNNTSGDITHPCLKSTFTQISSLILKQALLFTQNPWINLNKKNRIASCSCFILQKDSCSITSTHATPRNRKSYLFRIFILISQSRYFFFYLHQ